MFTTIPVEFAVDTMYELIVKSGSIFDTADEFERLILLCAEKDVCFFDGKMIRFPAGLPTGGPLSSLIANVFMNRLERWIRRFARYAAT